jgi:mono/diheme cytochrome c family protein
VGTDSGPALAQGVWMHGPDTYEGILVRVVHGVPKAYSTRGLAMPMRGWNTLSDAEARNVAAYVWSISHAWLKKKSPKPS